MFLNNYYQSKNRGIYILALLILFSVAVRIPAILIYGDTSLEHEWGLLVNNLIEHGQLVYEIFDDGFYVEPTIFVDVDKYSFNIDLKDLTNKDLVTLNGLYSEITKLFTNYSNLSYSVQRGVNEMFETFSITVTRLTSI